MPSARNAAVLGLIPARGGSLGVPGKNIRPLAGRPLLDYTCRAARASRCLTRIVVSTDCESIAAVARSSGVDVPFLRPAALATADARSVDVVLHALDWLRCEERWEPHIVVLLQPTAPFREPHDVDRSVELLERSDAASVVSVAPVPSHYHPDWQLVIRQERLATLSNGPPSRLPPRRQELPATYARNGAIYAAHVDAVRVLGTLMPEPCLPFVMPRERSINIDSLDDWWLAEQLLAHPCERGADAA
jgi:CMP-N-acetylneuraminic acid synthetase